MIELGKFLFRFFIVGCGMSVWETIKQRSTYTRRSNHGPLTLNSLTEKEKRQKGGTITQEHKDFMWFRGRLPPTSTAAAKPSEISGFYMMITVPR